MSTVTEPNRLRITRFAVPLVAGLVVAVGYPAAKVDVVLNAQERATQDRDRDRDRDLDRDRDRERGERDSFDDDLITLRSGAVIPIRLADEVDSRHDKRGQFYTGTVDPSVLVHDHVVIPRGTEAHIRLVEVKKGGHFHGKAKVRLELVSLVMNGERLEVETDQPSKKEGAAHAKASAEAKHGAEGAGVGAMTGNPAAFAGPVIAAFSAAKVDLKSGSRVEFTLEEPFTFRLPPVQTNQENR